MNTLKSFGLAATAATALTACATGPTISARDMTDVNKFGYMTFANFPDGHPLEPVEGLYVPTEIIPSCNGGRVDQGLLALGAGGGAALISELAGANPALSIGVGLVGAVIGDKLGKNMNSNAGFSCALQADAVGRQFVSPEQAMVLDGLRSNFGASSARGPVTQASCSGPTYVNYSQGVTYCQVSPGNYRPMSAATFNTARTLAAGIR